MRVTERMIYQRSLASTSRSAAEMERAAKEASSGARIFHPGDDSVASGSIIVGKAQAERFASIAHTSERAYDETVLMDAALGDVGAILVRAQQIALQAVNDSNSPLGRAAAAKEVESMIRGAASAMNVKLGNRYLFAGDLDSSPAFDSTGTYLGDAGTRRLEVAPGVILDTSLRADEVIGGAAGGVDVFAVLNDLALALAANDVAAVRTGLDDFTAAIAQVAAGRAELGGVMNVLETSIVAAKEAKDAAELDVGRQADADPIEAASRLALSQHALDAALTVAAQSFRLTLLDKLR